MRLTALAQFEAAIARFDVPPKVAEQPSAPAHAVEQQPARPKTELRTVHYNELSPAEQMAYRVGVTFVDVQIVGGPPGGGRSGGQ
jgi:hypothetical protein